MSFGMQSDNAPTLINKKNTEQIVVHCELGGSITINHSYIFMCSENVSWIIKKISD
jgi:hypothetical protein